MSEERFDLVVAYNVLMDVDDMPRAVAQIARVLRAGGRLCACVTHPLADAGAWQGRAADAPFVIDGSYLETERFESTMQRDGLTMTFAGTRYPLEAYARALEAAGLLIEALREPAAPPAARRDRQWQRLPMFLMFRAVKCDGL